MDYLILLTIANLEIKLTSKQLTVLRKLYIFCKCAYSGLMIVHLWRRLFVQRFVFEK